ncbi:MAG: cell division ATP-binding protein FtsE [Pseudomonadota bacterium]|uniref:cell division ATP-binding protein FtsE n=1 Tax=Thermithiobacillus tepidarius TaxID=929 RepID=UPI0004260FC1|nr:cell division ATP-binding protein FtsE [Thermithiobacillus tepidarius]
MIRAINVSKHYPGGRNVLQEIDLHLPKGQMAFLTGPSGAGKSTLLKLIARIETVSRGTLLLDGQDLAKLKRRHIPQLRRQLGIVFQDHKLLADRSVFANVALTLQVAGVRRAHIKSRVRAALDQVGLSGREQDSPLSLSGGEQQRVGIARAIVHSPKVLIADEPTGNLDPQLSSEIMDLFRNLNRHGMTLLIATHDLGQVERLDCPVYALQHGRLQNQEARP